MASRFLYINNKTICKKCWEKDDFTNMAMWDIWWKAHKGDLLCDDCKYRLEYTVIGRKNGTD